MNRLPRSIPSEANIKKAFLDGCLARKIGAQEVLAQFGSPEAGLSPCRRCPAFGSSLAQVHRSDADPIYGAFGGIMALPLWIYLSGCIFIFGACLCAAQAEALNTRN